MMLVLLSEVNFAIALAQSCDQDLLALRAATAVFTKS
jgi:hypothetical protein